MVSHCCVCRIKTMRALRETCLPVVAKRWLLLASCRSLWFDYFICVYHGHIATAQTYTLVKKRIFFVWSIPTLILAFSSYCVVFPSCTGLQLGSETAQIEIGCVISLVCCLSKAHFHISVSLVRLWSCWVSKPSIPSLVGADSMSAGSKMPFFGDLWRERMLP